MKLSEMQQLVKEVRALKEQRDSARAEARQLVQDLKFLAKIVTDTKDFYDWLIEQDNSSVLLNNAGPGNQVAGGTENKGDVTLALAWATAREKAIETKRKAWRQKMD